MAKCLNNPSSGASLNVSFIRYATSANLLASTPSGTRPIIGYVSSTDMTDKPQFCETAPSYRSDGSTALSGGEIYVQTGKANSRTFTAIKGRVININPQKVSQRSGSAWVELVAYLWLGSTWLLIQPDVTDTFDRSNSTNNLGNAATGQTWTNSTPLASAVGISGNQAYCNTASADASAVVESGIKDCKITIEVGSGVDDYFGVVFRYYDANNYCTGQFINSSHSFYVSGKFEGTAFGGTIAGYVITGLATINMGDVLAIRIYGSSVTLYINGVSVGTLTITKNLDRTKHGIVIYSNVTRINKFAVEMV